MIQIQNGRFHYNWRKTDQSKPYPRYETVRREFDAAFAAFTGFLASHQLGKVRPTQWEVTYVNLIEQGPLWSAAASWPQLLPGLLGTPGPATDDTRLESFDGTWHFELASERGRLHVSLRHTKRSTDPNDPELIRLELTARGPVGATGAPDLDAGLNLGHEAIVKKFAAVTSPAAHKYWGRQL
jgi:uncharacterized protein (TIGR04255 family)